MIWLAEMTGDRWIDLGQTALILLLAIEIARLARRRL